MFKNFFLPPKLTGDPTFGAGNTGVEVPPTELGPHGKEKLIVVKDTYSPNGTDVDRLSGEYKLGQGGAADIFRDFIGKVWTTTEASMGNPKQMIFLNPKMGTESGNSAASMPCDIYTDEANIVEDDFWTVWKQSIYVDPDARWMCEHIAKPAFGGDISDDVVSIVANFLSNPNSTLSPYENMKTSDANKAAEVVSYLLKWWKNALDFDNKMPLSPSDPNQQQLINRFVLYQDYNFIVPLPFDISMANNLLGVKPLIADLKSAYNFYIDPYECFVKTAGVQEQIIPNIYAFISSYIPENYQNENYSTSKKFQDLISLNNLLKGYDGSSLVTTPFMGKGGTTKDVPAAVNDYYKSWTTVLQNANEKQLEALSPLVKRYSNLLFPMDDKEMLKHYNNWRHMFPMYNDLRFSTGILTQFGDLFRATKLSHHFMNYYMLVGELLNQPMPMIMKKQEKFVTQEVSQINSSKLTSAGTPDASDLFLNINSEDEMKVMGLEPWLASMDIINLFPSSGGTSFAGGGFNVTADEEEFISLQGGLTNLENIQDLLDNVDVQSLFEENAVFITKNKNEDLAAVDSSNNLERTLLAAILVGKIRKIAKQYVRDYTKIATGQTAYSEALMYKVQKYKQVETVDDMPVLFPWVGKSKLPFKFGKKSSNQKSLDKLSGNTNQTDSGFPDDGGISGGVKVQTYYFLNSSEIDILRFIDSQVAYKTKYFYKVSSVQLVVGTEYSYEDVALLNTKIDSAIQYLDDWIPYAEATTTAPEAIPDILVQKGSLLSTRVGVRFKPKLNVVEVPFTQMNSRILDRPPIFPDSYIVPYKGVNNKVLINLNSQVGSYNMMPIALTPEEEKEFMLMREAQNVVDLDKPIQFRSDDPVAGEGYFQIFRTDKRPEEYKDFANKLVQNVSTAIPGSDLLDASSAAFVDTIEPNKKYYYIFRVVDVHGNFSNPSSVFEIEMIDDNGTVYFKQRVVELKKIELKTPSMPMRKYLQIRPSLPQSVLDADSMDLANADSATEYAWPAYERGPVQLGMRDESIWGKKIKIRLTSRATGKQIDINVTFKVTADNSMQMIADHMEGAASNKMQAAAGGVPLVGSEVGSGQPKSVGPLEEF